MSNGPWTPRQRELRRQARARYEERTGRQRTARQVWVTPDVLRAEGIVELGCVPASSVLYVQTSRRLVILHSTALEDPGTERASQQAYNQRRRDARASA